MGIITRTRPPVLMGARVLFKVCQAQYAIFTFYWTALFEEMTRVGEYTSFMQRHVNSPTMIIYKFGVLNLMDDMYT